MAKYKFLINHNIAVTETTATKGFIGRILGSLQMQWEAGDKARKQKGTRTETI